LVDRFPYYTWVRIITHIPNGITPCFITIQPGYNLFMDFMAHFPGILKIRTDTKRSCRQRSGARFFLEGIGEVDVSAKWEMMGNIRWEYWPKSNYSTMYRIMRSSFPRTMGYRGLNGSIFGNTFPISALSNGYLLFPSCFRLVGRDLSGKHHHNRHGIILDFFAFAVPIMSHQYEFDWRG